MYYAHIPPIFLRKIVMDNKKAYAAPVLVSYGNVSSLTRGGVVENADAPRGVNGTAYPPAS